MKFNLTVMEAMTRTPVVVGLEYSVENAIKLMLKSKVGSLIVKENNFLKGIVTEKDLVQKVLLKHLNPKNTKIKDVMSTTIVTVGSHVDLMEAVKLMTKYNVRKLPVIDKENNFVGLLTLNDILQVQPQLIELILDKSRLFSSKRGLVDAECDKCNIYGLVKLVNQRFLCQECERNESVINYLS